MFLLGSLACWAWKKWLERLSWTPLVGAAGLLALTAMLFTWNLIPLPETDRRHIFVWMTALLVAPIFALTRTFKFDARLGELSYPIYVTHVLALLVVGPDAPGMALALTIGLSLALTFAVERPVDRWRHNLTRASPRQ
jgi:peptidoglycan/LPS O-acetylase OafA/YrhL